MRARARLSRRPAPAVFADSRELIRRREKPAEPSGRVGRIDWRPRLGLDRIRAFLEAMVQDIDIRPWLRGASITIRHLVPRPRLDFAVTRKALESIRRPRTLHRPRRPVSQHARPHDAPGRTRPRRHPQGSSVHPASSCGRSDAGLGLVAVSLRAHGPSGALCRQDVDRDYGLGRQGRLASPASRAATQSQASAPARHARGRDARRRGRFQLPRGTRRRVPSLGALGSFSGGGATADSATGGCLHGAHSSTGASFSAAVATGHAAASGVGDG